MEIVLSMGLVLGTLLLGAISPGPSFVLVARSSIALSRADGIAAALGMGVGGLLFSALALLGLHALLSTVPALYLILKVLGGLYLAYMAVRIWRTAKEKIVIEKNTDVTTSRAKHSFVAGLLTQVCNPKTAIVYGSIFAALLPNDIPLVVYFILPPSVFLVEFGWYAVVALVLSSKSPRNAYLKSKTLFDRVASVALGALGVKLLSSANVS